MTATLYSKTVGKGPTMVMLHGWGWNSQIWEPLLPELSQYFQLVLIDLPGFGQSPLNITNYTYELIAPLLLEIVPNPAIWLGWSLGGMLAWQMAIHYPDKVKKLITVASSPRFVAGKDWPGVSETTLAKFAATLTTDYEKTLTGFLELQLRGNPSNQALLPDLEKQLLTDNQTPIAALKSSLKYLQATDFRSQVREVQCPELHIFGSLDRLVPAKVASLIPGQSEIITHSGHMPFLSQQESFIRLIKP